MKTYRILGIAIVTGKPDELDRVDKLAGGGYHIAKNPGKRKKVMRLSVETKCFEPGRIGGADETRG